MVLPRPLCRCKASAQGLTTRAPAGTIRACTTYRCPFKDARAKRGRGCNLGLFYCPVREVRCFGYLPVVSSSAAPSSDAT